MRAKGEEYTTLSPFFQSMFTIWKRTSFLCIKRVFVDRYMAWVTMKIRIIKSLNNKQWTTKKLWTQFYFARRNEGKNRHTSELRNANGNTKPKENCKKTRITNTLTRTMNVMLWTMMVRTVTHHLGISDGNRKLWGRRCIYGIDENCANAVKSRATNLLPSVHYHCTSKNVVWCACVCV